jgi:hypothetical protein
VSAWVKPAEAGADIVDPVVSQTATNISSFYLANAHDHWEFCLPTADSATETSDCAVSTSTISSSNLNKWVFVAGIWDDLNQELRLYVSSSGDASTPFIAFHTPLWLASTKVVAGRLLRGATFQYWHGEIYDPAVVPGVLSTLQITQLGADNKSPQLFSS